MFLRATGGAVAGIAGWPRSDAGYRAFLTRYPDQHVSVAVLCNAGSANPTQYAHAVADAYLGRLPRRPPPAGVADAAAHHRPRPFLPAESDVESYVTVLNLKLDRVWDLRFQRQL